MADAPVPSYRWFRPRRVWLPTWRLWLPFLLMLAGAVYTTLFHLHDWLAISRPITDAPYVVVEGWVPENVVTVALDWTRNHSTKLIFTTGVPHNQEQLLGAYPTYAEVCAQTLKNMGANPSIIRPAPVKSVLEDRTRAMAKGLKQALDAEHIIPQERRINLFTSDTHALRSWLHFSHELGPDWQVGVISVPSQGYDPSSWWRSSEGVKGTIQELLGLAAQGWRDLSGRH